MKNIFTLVLLAFSSLAFSQTTSNLIVFSEDASLFYLIVNGVRQNAEPVSNIKLTGIPTNSNQVTVQFADTKKGSVKKNMYFQDMGVEVTARITYTKKGYKLRYFQELPISTTTTAGQSVINYGGGQVVPASTPTNTTTTTTTPVNTPVTTTTNTTTTTTNTTTTNTTPAPAPSPAPTPVPTPVPAPAPSSTSNNAAVDLNYIWSPGAVYKFSTNQIDDVNTSMMGMNVKDKFTTTTEFALHILTVQSNGTANGVLYLIDYKVTDSKNTTLASINDIPADAVKSEVSVDKKGKFTFAKRLTLITSVNGNVLAYAKADGNSVSVGGQAGDMQVDAYAEFDPRTGQLKTGYTVNNLKSTKKVTVKVTEETDQLDVLPYDYLELLALPEGGIAQGDKSSMRSGIYAIDVTATQIANGSAKLNYKMKTDKSKDMFSGDAKATDANGNAQMDVTTDQMMDMNSMMEPGDKDAMNTMKGMSPDVTCDMTSDFSYSTGMFNQVSGVMTTSMNAMGMQLTVVSNLSMRKI